MWTGSVGAFVCVLKVQSKGDANEGGEGGEKEGNKVQRLKGKAGQETGGKEWLGERWPEIRRRRGLS